MDKIRLLIVFVSFALIFNGCIKKQTEILIGTQGPETGAIATSGLQILSGVKLAVKEINDNGGINGKKIRLINYDSRGDKVESVNVSKKLINDKVCAIAGDLTSGSIFAIRDIIDRSKTPLISSGATAKGATDGRPFVFRNILLDSDGVPALIDYVMKNKGYKNFAIITSMNNDSSVALSDLFRESIKSIGGKIIIEQSVFDGDTDMSAQVTSLKSKDNDIDIIVYSGYYQEASLILLEMRKQAMKQVIIGGDGIMFPDLWKVAGDASIGTLFFSGFAPDINTKEVNEFNIKVRSEMHTEPDAFVAQGYDAIYLFAEAIKKADVKNCADPVDRDKIRLALTEIKDFNGISGKMNFDKEGNAVKKPFIQEVYKKSNGEYSTRLAK